MRSRSLAAGGSLVLGLVLGSAPADAQMKVVPASAVPAAAGPPDIKAFVHLGVRTLGAAVPAGSKDGAAGPGELVLIDGSNFGKQPEVKIAGQKPDIVARTASGGIIARVPPATPVGERPVIVKTDKGDPSNRNVRFKRYAMVSIPKEKQVHVVELSETSSKRSVALPLDNVEDLRFSPDGAAGYVLTGKKGGEWKLAIVDMTPLDKPALKGDAWKKNSDVSAVVVARHAPRMAVIDATSVEIWNLADPLAPKMIASTPSPKDLASIEVQTAEMSPDGKAIAVVATSKNKLVVLRIDDKGAVESAGPSLDVLAGITPEHAARAVRFSPDGGTIYVISGPNPKLAAQAKKELVRLSPVSLPASGPPVVGKVRVLRGAKAPRDFVVTWGRVTGEGNFEARPPDDVAMIMAAAPDKLFEINPKDFADPYGRKHLLKIIGTEANPGLLYRMNEKGGDPVGLRMSTILLDVEVTPDSSRVVCFGLKADADGDDVTFEVGVASAPALAQSKDGILQTGFIGLTKIKPEELKAPFRYGEIRVQP